MLSQWYLIYVTEHEKIGLTYSKHFGHFLDFVHIIPLFSCPVTYEVNYIWKGLVLRLAILKSWFERRLILTLRTPSPYASAIAIYRI